MAGIEFLAGFVKQFGNVVQEARKKNQEEEDRYLKQMSDNLEVIWSDPNANPPRKEEAFQDYLAVMQSLIKPRSTGFLGKRKNLPGSDLLSGVMSGEIPFEGPTKAPDVPQEPVMLPDMGGPPPPPGAALAGPPGAIPEPPPMSPDEAEALAMPGTKMMSRAAIELINQEPIDPPPPDQDIGAQPVGVEPPPVQPLYVSREERTDLEAAESRFAQMQDDLGAADATREILTKAGHSDEEIDKIMGALITDDLASEARTAQRPLTEPERYQVLAGQEMGITIDPRYDEEPVPLAVAARAREMAREEKGRTAATTTTATRGAALPFVSREETARRQAAFPFVGPEAAERERAGLAFVGPKEQARQAAAFAWVGPVTAERLRAELSLRPQIAAAVTRAQTDAVIEKLPGLEKAKAQAYIDNVAARAWADLKKPIGLNARLIPGAMPGDTLETIIRKKLPILGEARMVQFNETQMGLSATDAIIEAWDQYFTGKKNPSPAEIQERVDTWMKPGFESFVNTWQARILKRWNREAAAKFAEVHASTELVLARYVRAMGDNRVNEADIQRIRTALATIQDTEGNVSVDAYGVIRRRMFAVRAAIQDAQNIILSGGDPLAANSSITAPPDDEPSVDEALEALLEQER